MKETKTELVRAVGYCRVSTEKQDTSMAAQETQIRAMAVVKGWELVDIVSDPDSFSGSLNRPGLTRVLDMVKAREIGAVIVAKLDRLTRSTRDVILLIELFNKKKVALVSLAESLDTKSSMGRFFVRMIASLAELERESIGDRTRMGMGHLKSLGMPVGTAPYGFRLAPGSNKLVPLANKQRLMADEGERVIVEHVRRLHAEQMSLRGIAQWLNDREYQTRRGTPWRFQYVARMLAGER